MESQFLPPLLNPRTTPPPLFFFFLKKLLRLKINILSSIYPEINFPAEPVMKINNLSRPKVPAPPPPQNQMVVPLLIFECHEQKTWNITCTYNAWILHRLSLLSFSFCSIKATGSNVCKKIVCFFYYNFPKEDSSEIFYVILISFFL